MKVLLAVIVFCFFLIAVSCTALAQTIVTGNADDISGWVAHIDQGAVGGAARKPTPSEDGQSLRLALAPSGAYQNATFTLNLGNPVDVVAVSPIALDFDYFVSNGKLPQALGFGAIFVIPGWTCKMEVQLDYVGGNLKGWDAAANSNRGGWVILNGGQTFVITRPAAGWHTIHITGSVIGDGGAVAYNHVDMDGMAQPVDKGTSCKASTAPASTALILALNGNKAGSGFAVYVDKVNLSY